MSEADDIRQRDFDRVWTRVELQLRIAEIEIRMSQPCKTGFMEDGRQFLKESLKDMC